MPKNVTIKLKGKVAKRGLKKTPKTFSRTVRASVTKPLGKRPQKKSLKTFSRINKVIK